MSLSYNSEPRVVFITQLLDQLNDGTIKIPRFQRELVWDWEQQRDLLCSIFEGLPIGAILMWHTTLSDIKSYSEIGPFQLEHKTSNLYNIYLMDGLQRLSTLYCTLLHPAKDAISQEEAKEVEVYCDLDAPDINSLFIQRKTIEKQKLDTSQGNFMPMSCALDMRELLRFQRNLPDDREDWLDKSDSIAAAFKSYKVPVVPLESNQQEIVTKSFERINTRGTQMSETHMLNALSYSHDFDLLQQIEELRDEYLSEYHHWYDIDTDYILSITKLYVGFDIYDKHTEKLARNISINTLHQVFKGISRLVEFSRTELGITKPSQFPYKIQLFALAYALKEENSITKEQLHSWYIISTYTGAFGVTARNSSSALEDLIRYINTGKFSWTLNFKPAVTRWSTNTHYRTARVKAWSSALGEKVDTHYGTNKQTHNQVIESKGGIIQRPTEIEEINDIPKKLKSRAGLYFVNTGKPRDKLSISNLNSEEKEMHFLTDYLLHYLDRGDIEGFAKERELLIYNWEVKHIVKPAAQKLGIHNISYD
ncbi:DUF262 domain-containing protein [Vibrio vulnificus]